MISNTNSAAQTSRSPLLTEIPKYSLPAVMVQHWCKLLHPGSGSKTPCWYSRWPTLTQGIYITGKIGDQSKKLSWKLLQAYKKTTQSRCQHQSGEPLPPNLLVVLHGLAHLCMPQTRWDASLRLSRTPRSWPKPMRTEEL